MDSKPYIIGVITVMLVFDNVNGIPLKKNSAGRENTNGNDLTGYEKQVSFTDRAHNILEDENVRELKNLKSTEDANGILLANTKSQKFIFTDANGNKERHAEIKEQLNKNGELVERIEQNIDSKQNSESATPHTHVITEIEIPPKGIHKWFERDNARKNFQKKAAAPTKQKYSGADNIISSNVLDALKTKNIIKYLPAEMAEYIYKTGDEKTVTMAIENYLQLGIMNREEAIAYLQEIKSILYKLEEYDQRDKKEIQMDFMQNLYEIPQNKMDMNQALADLKDIQQLIQNKFIKKSYNGGNKEKPNIHYRYSQEDNENSNDNYADDSSEQFHTLEKDYRNLMEKLQNFDNLFSESSMEGVIYQLAKVLFYQSFSMNGFEAQESLKQFTSFLETQVDEGHISRNMEHKVLDILLAALTDILNEHPELISGKNSEPYQKQVLHNENALSAFNVAKNGNSNKKRHTKMNFKHSGILDEDKNNH